MEIASPHLSDEVIVLLHSMRINSRLFYEMMPHHKFREMMADIEIIVDRMAVMLIQDMNMILEGACQKVIERYAPDEVDVYLRTLEVAQVTESDYFSHIVHGDIDEILAVQTQTAGQPALRKEVLFMAEENCLDYPADNIKSRLPGSPE